MSLATSVKDYVEITHKLIEIEPLKNYTEFGAVFTYFIFSIGDFLKSFFSFSFLRNIWSIPIIIPDIASAMISEVSVLDSYFHNAFTFLVGFDSITNTNPALAVFEKFIIGLINSFFLFLPTSTSHLITIRRFVMQGLEAGYIAGIGTIAGNFLWLASIILGWRFFVIPWLSLDIFRYLLGFLLLVKYIWDSRKDRMALEDLSKWKIFLLNFLLALTEQSCIYPFVSNLSIGPEANILEGFPVENYAQFLTIHGAYLLGILLGSFSLLQFSCWFWENPAFSIYLWITTKSTLKVTTSTYYKILNFIFLYATMLCAIASIPYYGLDYTITKPLGLVPQDRILEQKKSQSDPDRLLTETAFLNINPTDKNSRIRDGVHARRERWKQRLIKYQAYDASLYDQGVYDFLTIEDLNYGFDRFWSRRKMRNHQIRFRLFPGPWMRSLKKQLNNPPNSSSENSTKSATGPRVEFFRILFEQFYHPNFHDSKYLSNKKSKQTLAYKKINNNVDNLINQTKENKIVLSNNNSYQEKMLNAATGQEINWIGEKDNFNIITQNLNTQYKIKPGTIYSNSALRKFVRNFNTRLNTRLGDHEYFNHNNLINKTNSAIIYSKRWKALFSKQKQNNSLLGSPGRLTLKAQSLKTSDKLFRNVSRRLLLTPEATSLKLATISQKISTKEQKLLNLRTYYKLSSNISQSNSLGMKTDLNNKKVALKNLEQAGLNSSKKIMLLRPLNVYLQKEHAFKRKLRYYGTIPMRKLTIGNQAPYFKALMKRGFYFYKPSLRLKKTFYVASMRRGFRKKSRKQQNLIMFEPARSSNLSLRSSLQKANSKENLSPSNFSSSEKEVASLPGAANQLLLNKDQDFKKLTPPTHSYTVLGKRASRYRHQIYKDVLQHWYYTPFNRLLLKFSVDSFINRQPKTHFLTKNEERLLHIRRFLLSEHYDTLRWYTYMQHYRTMKTNIGGTKSFANRSYNQQAQGTFKKIRHLFAITPKQGDLYTLKFDQALYNDNKMKDNVYFHEELLTSNNTITATALFDKNSLMNFKTNNLDTNSNPDKALLCANSDVCQDRLTINNLENTSMTDLITQSSYFLGKDFLNTKDLSANNKDFSSLGQQQQVLGFGENNKEFVPGELFVKLISACKKRVHNQAFLKNYITHRIEKREQLMEEQNNSLKKRLEKLDSWFTFNPNNYQESFLDKKQKTNNLNANSVDQTIVTTGMQKAVTDSLAFTFNGNLKGESNSPLLIKTTQNQIKTAYTILTEQQILAKLDLISSVSNKQAVGGIGNISQVGKTKIAKIKQFVKNQINTIKPILINQTKWCFIKTNKNLQWWRKKQRVITKRKAARKRDRFKKELALVSKKLTTLNKQLVSPLPGQGQDKAGVRLEKSSVYKTLYGNYDISDFIVPTTDNSINNVKSIYKTENLTNKDLLRKKEDNKAFAGLKDIKNPWTGFFVKKLRKKASSKGRRYRSLSLARYLTATRKPRLVGFDGLTKVVRFDNTKSSKEEKQEMLNQVLNIKPNLNQTTKKSQIKKRSRHSWKKRVRQQFARNHYKYRKRHLHGNGKLRMMNKKLKKLKNTYELRQWWWNSFLPRYLNNSSLPKTNQNSAFKPLSNQQNFSNTTEQTAVGLPVKTNNLNLLNNLNSQKNQFMLENIQTKTVNNNSTINYTTTTLPFYAGWDESLRKFVITNRLLSRRDTGLVSKTINSNPLIEYNFTNTPVQGLNEGSFLYWQTDMSFNAYNIDQFITTNQSFYAPLGWRRFELRHSILKTWTTQSKSLANNLSKTKIISIKNLQKLNTFNGLTSSKQIKKLATRRIKKRYKLLKQTPNQLMYAPTGPLLISVLPSHYISVFDQQSRFPRNRYLKRNLLKAPLKQTTLDALVDNKNQTNTITKDFTLRKRVKPRRKYHRKRFIKKEGLIFPRRQKFSTNIDVLGQRSRPENQSKQKRKEIFAEKTKTNKRVKTNPLRLQRLRRREFQQIIKPMQRYMPQNGGFTWPGDYLRLEVVEMPKLKEINVKKTSLKQKINVQPVGIMPRKYLIQKHNIFVLKKKLEKAYALHNLNKTVNEYKLLREINN
jgi:hypothetical protein